MSISTQAELEGMQQISSIVAQTLKQMREYAKAGMNTKELDEHGAAILNSFGAKSAPKLTYGFPG
jgi:methionyl aminopeptidase